jgi:hypothetical protein
LAIILSNTIVMRPVAALIPYARNARTHSDAQVAQIAASIREFGFTNPRLIDELLKLEPVAAVVFLLYKNRGRFGDHPAQHRTEHHIIANFR